MDKETEEAAEEVVELSLHDQVRAAVEAVEDPEIEQAAEKSETEEEQEAASEEEAPQEEAEETQEEEPLSAPVHWSQDDQTAFAGLAREAQTVVLKREKDFESDYTTKMQEISGIKAILDSNKQYFESLGTTPDAVLDYFINADKTLRTGMPEAKAEALLGVAQRYGVDLAPKTIAPSQTEESQFYDGAGEPVDIAAMVNQVVAPIQQQLGQVTNAFGQMLTSQQQTELTTVNAQIETFRNDKDESGALKHPHFDRLKPQLEHLAAYERSTGKTPDLAQLYTSACALDSQAREEMVTSQVASLNDKRKEDTEKKKKAAKAQFTGSAESGPSQASKKDYKTPQDAARAAFEALTGD